MDVLQDAHKQLQTRQLLRLFGLVSSGLRVCLACFLCVVAILASGSAVTACLSLFLALFKLLKPSIFVLLCCVLCTMCTNPHVLCCCSNCRKP